MVLNGTKLWKSVEIFHANSTGEIARCGEPDAEACPLRACSACAGDYEDPDRTAWTEEPEITTGDDEDAERASDDSSPAR